MEGHIFEGRGMRAVTLPFEKIRVLPQETRRGEGFLPRRMAPVVAAAEEMLGREIPAITKELWELFFTTGERQRFDDAYIERRTMLLTLTLAESFEGQGRFLCKLCEVLGAILDEPTWILAAHLEANSDYRAAEGLPPRLAPGRAHGLDIMAGATGACVAVTYYYLGDVIRGADAGLYDKMDAAFRVRIIDPFLLSHAHWTGPEGRRVNNWCPWIVTNTLFVAAVAEPDDGKRCEVVKRAMHLLDHFIAGYPADGGCDEGASYWGAAGAAYYDALELLLHISGGKLHIFDDPKVRAIGDYLPGCHIKETRFVNFADCPPRLAPDATMLYHYSTLTHSERLAAFAGAVAKYEEASVAYSFPYRVLLRLYSEMPADVGYTPERNSYFPYLKVLVSRRGDYLLASKGGHNGESHNHNDVGNFLFCYRGEPVLIDTGCGVYSKITFSERRYELYYMNSSYHNLPDFDGIQQRQGAAFASRDEVYDGDGGWSLELAGAYPGEAGIRSYRRAVSLDDTGATVRDTFSLEREELVTFHFMCAAKPEPVGEGRIALPLGRVLTFDPRLEYVLDAFPVSDTRLERAWSTDTFYRLCFRVRAAAGDFTFRIE